MNTDQTDQGFSNQLGAPGQLGNGQLGNGQLNNSNKQIFVAEFVCGGGMYDTPIEQIPSSLLSEGELMWRALVEDISEWAEVTTPTDPRLSLNQNDGQVNCVAMNPEKRPWSQWISAARGCDQVVIVAPETDCLLTQGISAFRAAGFQVLAVSSAALRMASDKWQTAKWLHREGIPHPETWAWDSSGNDLIHSAPLAHASSSASLSDPGAGRYWVKPRDGCSAMGIRCFRRFDEAIRSMLPHEITQRHAEGRSGSIIAVGNGVDHSYALMPAVWQSLRPGDDSIAIDDLTHSEDASDPQPEWAYQGGCGPVADEIQRRAEVLAERVVGTLPGKLGGFIGVDWIAAEDPCLDCVIEVNPRLTTSYIGVRQTVQENLTKRLLYCPDGYSTSRPVSNASPESIHWSINQPLQSLRSHPDRRPRQ